MIPPSRPIWAEKIKRLIDVFGAALGLAVVSPVLLLIAVAVKLQDGGPIIYRRRVVGRNGCFDALKFRTMRPDADAILEADENLRDRFEKNFKLENDPRVTGLGSWLRRHSLDEFPQLFNVLAGDMSLVGPRMVTPAELVKYGNRRELLLSVKPGLTGYWQVEGRQKIGYERRVEMDVYYVQHWSLKLDFIILCKTPWEVLKGEGAL